MDFTKDYISPVFEHRLDDNGRGIAGFTVHQQGLPFANCIRHFTFETHNAILEELNQLRNELLANVDANYTNYLEERSL